MITILPSPDDGDNGGTQVRSWRTAPVSWLRIVESEGDPCDVLDAKQEIDRRNRMAHLDLGGVA